MITTMEQLRALKELTRTTGVVHEVQIFQLKIWGMVISNHIESHVMNIDLEKRAIDFDLKTKGKAPKDFKERCGRLNDWVKQLLGDEWLVRIKVKGKVFFRGPKRNGRKQQVSKDRKETNL